MADDWIRTHRSDYPPYVGPGAEDPPDPDHIIDSFRYKGRDQSWMVPPGVEHVKITMIGGCDPAEHAGTPNTWGLVTELDVNEGEDWIIRVGGRPHIVDDPDNIPFYGGPSRRTSTDGGWPDGGDGHYGHQNQHDAPLGSRVGVYYGGGGSGSSSIWKVGADAPFVVAPGGGGGGSLGIGAEFGGQGRDGGGSASTYRIDDGSYVDSHRAIIGLYDRVSRGPWLHGSSIRFKGQSPAGAGAPEYIAYAGDIYSGYAVSGTRTPTTRAPYPYGLSIDVGIPGRSFSNNFGHPGGLRHGGSGASAGGPEGTYGGGGGGGGWGGGAGGAAWINSEVGEFFSTQGGYGGPGRAGGFLFPTPIPEGWDGSDIVLSDILGYEVLSAQGAYVVLGTDPDAVNAVWGAFGGALTPTNVAGLPYTAEDYPTDGDVIWSDDQRVLREDTFFGHGWVAIEYIDTNPGFGWSVGRIGSQVIIDALESIPGAIG